MQIAGGWESRWVRAIPGDSVGQSRPPVGQVTLYGAHAFLHGADPPPMRQIHRVVVQITPYGAVTSFYGADPSSCGAVTFLGGTCWVPHRADPSSYGAAQPHGAAPSLGGVLPGAPQPKPPTPQQKCPPRVPHTIPPPSPRYEAAPHLPPWGPFTPPHRTWSPPGATFRHCPLSCAPQPCHGPPRPGVLAFAPCPPPRGWQVTSPRWTGSGKMTLPSAMALSPPSSSSCDPRPPSWPPLGPPATRPPAWRSTWPSCTRSCSTR